MLANADKAGYGWGYTVSNASALGAQASQGSTMGSTSTTSWAPNIWGSTTSMLGLDNGPAAGARQPDQRRYRLHAGARRNLTVHCDDTVVRQQVVQTNAPAVPGQPQTVTGHIYCDNKFAFYFDNGELIA